MRPPTVELAPRTAPVTSGLPQSWKATDSSAKRHILPLAINSQVNYWLIALRYFSRRVGNW